MKNRLQCPHCDRSFENTGKGGLVLGRLAANLANHIKGAHPDKYKPSHFAIERNKRKDQLLGKIDNLPNATPVETKRAYTPRKKSEAAVSFCPKCGCNIRAVQVAMGL